MTAHEISRMLEDVRMTSKAIKVLSVFGTRPEAVKMAPVVKALTRADGVISHVCVTAQHREMLDQVLELFEIKPDVDLNLMQENQSLGQLTTDIFSGLDPVLSEYQPDWVLVQGDTTTVMTAALLSFYRHIRVGHVEAGLRTGDRRQPFPEEINRRIAGVVADLHFAPTEHSRRNLLKEGVEDRRIFVTGNPVIDALHSIVDHPVPKETMALLDGYHIAPGEKELILVTAHRRENFGEPIAEICAGLKEIARHYGERIHLVYPVHMNPNIQEPVYRLLGDIENISLMPPMDYLPMVHLMKRAKLVLTDSGGLQEEATALNIPALVLREVTERPEGVSAGVLKLVGSSSERIFEETQRLMDDAEAYQRFANAPNPYGDGHAAEYIVRALLDFNEG
jgi:UDP-N-acetylglucosamine 2-epimerase (non-hydrolysing)